MGIYLLIRYLSAYFDVTNSFWNLISCIGWMGGPFVSFVQKMKDSEVLRLATQHWLSIVAQKMGIMLPCFMNLKFCTK